MVCTMVLFFQGSALLNYNLTICTVLIRCLINNGINMTELVSSCSLLSNKICLRLSYLKTYARLSDNNTKEACENIFKEVFNVLYGLNLVNANEIKPNYPAVDLIDKSKSICYQITTQQNVRKKVSDTINMHKKHGLDKIYSQLYIFF